MTAQAQLDTVLRRRAGFPRLDDPDEVSSILAAGARARAAAEACDACGLAAVLLDGLGRVLHVGTHAAGMLSPVLRIAAGHVLGRDATANAAIETVLNPILARADSGGAGDAAGRFADAAGDGSVIVAALPFEDAYPGQLLKALLLIGPSREGLGQGLARLAL